MNLVYKDNLDAYTPIVLDLIDQCTMVSIDTEFSGLGDSKMTRQPNIQDRYTALKSTVEDHTLLALGLSIFGKGTVSNFHFLMYSKSDFKISSSSIEFLAKNNFDFNFLFSNGISLDRNDRNPLLLKIWQSLFNRLIVVHNGWLDLMYLYSFLYCDLPLELGSFIADLHDMFKLGIYDTKYIADYEYREKASFLGYLFGKW
jgi:target of EGR1 protein 1